MTNPRGPQRGATSLPTVLRAAWRLPGSPIHSVAGRPIGSICSAWLLAPSGVSQAASAASREQRLGNRVLTNPCLYVRAVWSVAQCVCVCVITYHILRPTRPIREALIVCAREVVVRTFCTRHADTQPRSHTVLVTRCVPGTVGRHGRPAAVCSLPAALT